MPALTFPVCLTPPKTASWQTLTCVRSTVVDNRSHGHFTNTTTATLVCLVPWHLAFRSSSCLYRSILHGLSLKNRLRHTGRSGCKELLLSTEIALALIASDWTTDLFLVRSTTTGRPRLSQSRRLHLKQRKNTCREIVLVWENRSNGCLMRNEISSFSSTRVKT